MEDSGRKIPVLVPLHVVRSPLVVSWGARMRTRLRRENKGRSDGRDWCFVIKCRLNGPTVSLPFAPLSLGHPLVSPSNTKLCQISPNSSIDWGAPFETQLECSSLLLKTGLLSPPQSHYTESQVLQAAVHVQYTQHLLIYLGAIYIFLMHRFC